MICYLNHVTPVGTRHIITFEPSRPQSRSNRSRRRAMFRSRCGCRRRRCPLRSIRATFIPMCQFASGRAGGGHQNDYHTHSQSLLLQQQHLPSPSFSLESLGGGGGSDSAGEPFSLSLQSLQKQVRLRSTRRPLAQRRVSKSIRSVAS